MHPIHNEIRDIREPLTIVMAQVQARVLSGPVDRVHDANLLEDALLAEEKAVYSAQRACSTASEPSDA